MQPKLLSSKQIIEWARSCTVDFAYIFPDWNETQAHDMARALGDFMATKSDELHLYEE